MRSPRPRSLALVGLIAGLAVAVGVLRTGRTGTPESRSRTPVAASDDRAVEPELETDVVASAAPLETSLEPEREPARRPVDAAGPHDRLVLEVVDGATGAPVEGAEIRVRARE